MTLAIFDLDNTLLAGDSDHAWGVFLAQCGIVDAESHSRTNDRHFAEYNAGILDVREFIEFQLRPLKENPRPLMEKLRTEFMREVISPMISDWARALVDEHRSLGHRLMIITSTNRFITAPIAREFGIDTLIAVEVEETDGGFTGRTFDVPSFGKGKVTRLKNWMAGQDETLDGSWFYSDSRNDLPLLRVVDNPVAVNPDPVLREEAARGGWKIIDLE